MVTNTTDENTPSGSTVEGQCPICKHSGGRDVALLNRDDYEDFRQGRITESPRAFHGTIWTRCGCVYQPRL